MRRTREKAGKQRPFEGRRTKIKNAPPKETSTGGEKGPYHVQTLDGGEKPGVEQINPKADHSIQGEKSIQATRPAQTTKGPTTKKETMENNQLIWVKGSERMWTFLLSPWGGRNNPTGYGQERRKRGKNETNSR